MPTFPAIEPLRRSYELADFPMEEEAAWPGVPVRYRTGYDPLAAGGMVLRLDYEDLSGAQIQLIRNHWKAQQGGIVDFNVPPIIWQGNTSQAAPALARWRYLAPPEETQKKGNRYDVSIELESLMSLATDTLAPPPPPPPPATDVIIYANSSGAIASTSPTTTLDGGTTVVASGGPFDEPFIQQRWLLTGAAIDFGVGDFTLETWYRRTNTDNSSRSILSFYPDSFEAYFTVREQAASSQRRVFWVVETYPPEGSSEFYEVSGLSALNQWRHLAIVRADNVMSVWDNGTAASDVNFGSYTEPVDWSDLTIDVEGQRVDIGQTRITPGEALYSGSTITVPTAPFVTP